MYNENQLHDNVEMQAGINGIKTAVKNSYDDTLK